MSKFTIRERDGYIEFISRDSSITSLARTEYIEDIWNIVKDQNWTVRKNSQGKPKYLYCAKLKKSLHQIVIDYYFSEEKRKELYEKGFIIEHLNNNGFDCRISNLFFMNRIRNKYKGDLFDQQVPTLIDKASIRIIHKYENKTFQIILAFNYPLKNKNSGKILDAVFMLYEYNYDIVFQDAETLVEYLSHTISFSIAELRKNLRCKQIKVRESEDYMGEVMEKYPDIKPGNVITYNGELLIAVGKDGDNIAYREETPPIENWNIPTEL